MNSKAQLEFLKKRATLDLSSRPCWQRRSWSRDDGICWKASSLASPWLLVVTSNLQWSLTFSLQVPQSLLLSPPRVFSLCLYPHLIRTSVIIFEAKSHVNTEPLKAMGRAGKTSVLQMSTLKPVEPHDFILPMNKQEMRSLLQHPNSFMLSQYGL